MKQKDLVKLIEYHSNEAHNSSINLLFQKANYHAEQFVFYKQMLKEETK